jgi:hypothetical protein
MILKAFGIAKALVREASDGGRIIEFVASTADFDRENDRVMPSGMRAFPAAGVPFLWSHDRWEIAPGRVTSLTPGEGVITGSAWLQPKGVNRLADDIAAAWGKTVNTVSIGFMSFEATLNERQGRDYTDFEIVEVSACNIPMNPGAVARGDYAEVARTMTANYAVEVAAREQLTKRLDKFEALVVELQSKLKAMPTTGVLRSQSRSEFPKL